MPPKMTTDIVIPAYSGNMDDVQNNTPTLYSFLEENFSKIQWRITIAYNGNSSTEIPRLIAFAKKYPRVRLTRVEKAGKGAAILNAINETKASILIYLDADMATNITALPALFQKMIDEEADIVSGSRYHPQSTIRRNPTRLLVSWVYTHIFLRMIGARFTDPQCGFKAIRVGTIRDILPYVKDSWFFFESELELVAQRRGLKIVEIPIDWKEMTNSSVKLVPTIVNFLGNMKRMMFDTPEKSEPEWVAPVHLLKEAKPDLSKPN